METYEIILAVAAVAAALAGAFYEWRHTRTDAKEALELRHSMIREMDSIKYAFDSLEQRIAGLEDAVSQLTELKPIAQRTQRTRSK